jgi:hypothetical protein
MAIVTATPQMTMEAVVVIVEVVVYRVNVNAEKEDYPK